MATRRKKRTKKERNYILFPSGLTVLNCACSDDYRGAFRSGKIVNMAGDKSAGKSILAMTTFAMVANNPKYDHYRLIYDDAELGEDFDKEKLFGKKLINRLEPPAKDTEGNPVPSDTVEDFHMHIKDAVNEGKPFIYILDSWDSLDAKDDKDKIEKIYKKYKKGEKEETGTYGTAKAKQASAILRNIKGEIGKTESLLIIVSQRRDNINAGMFGPKKTKTGGKALPHYSWYEINIDSGAQLKASDAEKTQIGTHSYISFEKNRQTGKRRKVEFDIYYDIGVDDIGSSIDFLIKRKYYTTKKIRDGKKKKEVIVFDSLDYEGSKVGLKKKLISHIEDNDLESELQKLVGKCWNEYEDSLKLNRKKRFE